MKPINRSKVLHKEGNTPNNKSVIHKPSKKSEKAKEEVFGKTNKPKVYTNKKKNPYQKKNKKKSKKAAAGLPLGAKIGGGVAAVAVVGGSVAAVVNHLNSKNNVQDANRHSDDTGLKFGTDKDDKDNKDEKLKKDKKKKDEKLNKDSKRKGKSDSEDILSDLLGGDDSSDSSSADSSKSKGSKKDKDLEDLINGMSGGSSKSDSNDLKELAEKADKSISKASKLGKGKEALGKNKPENIPNAKEKDNKDNGLTSLDYKPNKDNKDKAVASAADRGNQLENNHNSANRNQRPTTSQEDKGESERPTNNKPNTSTSEKSKPNTNSGSSDKPSTNPGGSDKPKPGTNPGGSDKPKPSTNPGGSDKPSPSTNPSGSDKTKPSTTPSGSDTPKPSTTPSGSDTPKPSTTPSGSDTPKPSTNPGGSDKPKPGTNPGGSDKPKPSTNPGGSDKPSPSTNPSGSDTPDTNPDEPTPTYPYQDVPDGTSKQVQFMNSDGQIVGKGTLSKNGNTVNVSNIPDGYTLSDEDSEGHSAQLLQWPDTVTVIGNGTHTPSTNTNTGDHTQPTPTYPYQDVPDGTTKQVQFVDSDGRVVGTGELSKNGNSVNVNGIPGGYKLSDEDSDGHSAQLLQWPNTITVVSDGTAQPSKPKPTYPAQTVADGTTKQVQFVDSDGRVVGTGELSKNGNSVNVNGIPGGYKLSDEDSDGHSAQLLQWPNTITVVSDGTAQPSKPKPTYPAQTVADGSSKTVEFVDQNGNVVGTGTLSKNNNQISISDIPGGYKLADEDGEGHSQQLLQWPDKLSVVSDGSSQPSSKPEKSGNTDPDNTEDPNQGRNTDNPTYPFLSVADGTKKEVQFVDSNGKVVGTGELTKSGNSVHLGGIPGGYKLSDEDSNGHSAQLYQWPNTISVVPDGSNPSTNPTDNYPASNVPSDTTKSVQFIDQSGKVIGTGKLIKNGNTIRLDGIPGGYKLADEDSEGHSAQLLQWPDTISVVEG